MKSIRLKKYKYIKHNFFDRKGGVSQGIYESLNCGIGSGDNAKNIRKNLSIVKKRIGCKKNNLILLKQYHSNKCYFIKKNRKKRIFGDGLITNQAGIALGILTADCAPILFFDKKNKIIGAAHAGWRGAYKNIMRNMINLFKKNGSNIEDLIAAVGPCISKQNYEVKTKFLNKFLRRDKKNIKFFQKKTKRLYFDLTKYIKNQLKRLGVKEIDVISVDTYKSQNNYFSARYSKNNNLGDYGRNISIIMIK